MPAPTNLIDQDGWISIFNRVIRQEIDENAVSDEEKLAVGAYGSLLQVRERLLQVFVPYNKADSATWTS